MPGYSQYRRHRRTKMSRNSRRDRPYRQDPRARSGSSHPENRTKPAPTISQRRVPSRKNVNVVIVGTSDGPLPVPDPASPAAGSGAGSRDRRRGTLRARYVRTENSGLRILVPRIPRGARRPSSWPHGTYREFTGNDAGVGQRSEALSGTLGDRGGWREERGKSARSQRGEP
jgi:hypothetical protein